RRSGTLACEYCGASGKTRISRESGSSERAQCPPGGHLVSTGSDEFPRRCGCATRPGIDAAASCGVRDSLRFPDCRLVPCTRRVKCTSAVLSLLQYEFPRKAHL